MLVVVIAVLGVVTAATLAIAAPAQDESATSLYLGTENETGAETASDFPTSFTFGESEELTVGIDGAEASQYTIVVALERVETSDGEPTVLMRNELGRLHPTVDGEQWSEQHTVTPTSIGEDLRLHYYLYKGASAPDNPGESSAYRDVYLWIDVEDEADG